MTHHHHDIEAALLAELHAADAELKESRGAAYEAQVRLARAINALREFGAGTRPARWSYRQVQAELGAQGLATVWRLAQRAECTEEATS